MRKVFGGVTLHPDQLVEWYNVSIKNEDESVENLLSERFDRKKSYGLDFVISTANSVLEQSLTEEEISWLQNVDPLELQTLILAQDVNGNTSS
jgi:hypothetical protein